MALKNKKITVTLKRVDVIIDCKKFQVTPNSDIEAIRDIYDISFNIFIDGLLVLNR